MQKSELLVIDDDPISILLSKFFLEKSLSDDSAIRITTFSCPIKGFEYVKDLVLSQRDRALSTRILLDLNMPGINGWEFLELLKKIDPTHKIKVIIHSSSNSKKDKDKALEINHIEYYLPKPMTHIKASKLMSSFPASVPLSDSSTFFNSYTK